VRVVSLVPSVTETLLEWGVEVVACTRFCEQPAIAHVGGTKDPEITAIVELAPDLVVMDREENRREDAEALVAAGVELHVTHVTALTDVADAVAGLAGAVGAPPAEVVLDEPTPVDMTAFVAIWRRPWMTLNERTYGSTLLQHLGVGNVFGSAPDQYPIVDLDEVARRRPQLVLLPSEPYPFSSRHIGEVRRACPDVRIRLVDGKDLFWWGSRTPGAVARLREVLRAG
jgi:ABC-type Fe3+-hydroxamate transport system substrate-binding protein